METAQYFSGNDSESIAIMEEMHRRSIFFIEEHSSQLWVLSTFSYDFRGDCKTNDPHKAMRFESKFEAMTYMVKNHLKFPTWVITEHKFI